MASLKRLMVALLALLPLAAGTAFAEPDHGYSRMFVFGDSLSDPGNNFAVTGETSKPPFDPLPFASYGVGGHHYTNGRTWIEYMAQEMGLTEWAKPAYRDPAYGNYAYAYARARLFNPDPPGHGFDAPSLGEQLEDWAAAGYCTGTPMDDTLFVIQFGANDVVDALTELGETGDPSVVEPIFGDAIMSIVGNVGYLHDFCGARRFLVVNVPDAGLTPFALAQGPEAAAIATMLTTQFNLNLQSALDMYLGDLDITPLDFFGVSNALVLGAEEFGFTNVTGTCLAFGVKKQAFCSNRDEYFYWDVVHPTKKAHAIIGAMSLGTLLGSD